MNEDQMKLLDKTRVQPLLLEANELVAIMVASSADYS
jgi:hypothetical protein